jgi:SHAQKYF class myb-like DNA-binding protein
MALSRIQFVKRKKILVGKLKLMAKSPQGERDLSSLFCLFFLFSFVLSPRRWTPDEHRLFLEGIMLYGKDWKKMQPLIKTRSLVQIRTHAQKVFKKIGLKKIAGVLKRRSGDKEGSDDVGDEELEDVLDDDLEHLGMMEGVDEAMLSSLAQVTASFPPSFLSLLSLLLGSRHGHAPPPHGPSLLVSSRSLILSQHAHSGGGLMISGHHSTQQVPLPPSFLAHLHPSGTAQLQSTRLSSPRPSQPPHRPPPEQWGRGRLGRDSNWHSNDELRPP